MAFAQRRERKLPPLKITLHSNQLKAYTSKKRIIALISGVSGGKTTVGGLWTAKKTADMKENETFIVVAPDYKILNHSTLPWFLYTHKGCGQYHKQANEFHIAGGGTVYFISMVDPDSIEGIQNVKGIWVDEAGKINDNGWVNIQARSARTRAQILLTSTPYFMNWLYDEVYKPWESNQRQDIELVQFSSIANPSFPKDEFERQRSLLDPRDFERKYCGTFTKMTGLVYYEFDDANLVDSFRIDSSYFVCCGVDIGYEAPFALVVRAMHELNGDFQIAEFYKSYLSSGDKIEVMRQFKSTYNISQFYVDSAHPETIQTFRQAGLPVTPVVKGKDSVQNGISLHNELIKTKRHKVFKDKCPNSLIEYKMYHFPDQKSKEIRKLDNPVKVNDHCFVAGTKVDTIKGKVNIEDIRTGDLVLTSKGYKEVTKTWKNDNQEVNEYEINGNLLTSTPNHNILTLKGKVPISQLHKGDTVIVKEDKECQIPLNLKVLYIEGIETLKQEQNVSIIEEPQVTGQDTYIETYTKNIMVRYMKDFMSIIKMVTHLITISKTLNLLRNLSIYLIMLKIGMRRIKKALNNILKISDILQKIGIQVKKVENGTLNMVKEPGKIGIELLNIVNTVEKRLTLNSLIKSIAITTVKHLNTDKKRKETVYNLTVKDIHEYFANNILVSNCMDATRYATMMTTHIRDKMWNKPRPQYKDHMQRLISGEFSKDNIYHEQDWYE